jgi:hypothetical protein
MSGAEDDDVSVSDSKLTRIQNRTLKAEKEKLHLDNPRGIINDIEAIIREEVD